MSQQNESGVVVHHRLSGQPGVRVQHLGVETQRKRVTGVDSNDHKLIPKEVLREIELICMGERPLSLSEALNAIREHLSPWL